MAAAEAGELGSAAADRGEKFPADISLRRSAPPLRGRKVGRDPGSGDAGGVGAR